MGFASRSLRGSRISFVWLVSFSVRISASLLSADFSRLGEEALDALSAGADEIHFDLADGIFAPNLTFGVEVVRSLRRLSPAAFFDVHLMVVDPTRLIDEAIDAGASAVTIHLERSASRGARLGDDAEAEIRRVAPLLSRVRRRGCEAGLALNPDSDLRATEAFRGLLNRIVLMGVRPGFGGQRLLEGTFERVSEVREMLSSDSSWDSSRPVISVDGGIDSSSASGARRAGADVLVSGSSIFSARRGESRRRRVASLRGEDSE